MRLARCGVVLGLLVGVGVVQVAGGGAAMASSGIAYVQGTSFSTGSRLASTAVQLGQPVASGDLLVGWFAAWEGNGVSQPVQVADNVNGAWTRAAASLSFGGTGDIALYYVANSQVAAGGLTVTVSAPTTAYFQGTLAEYSGVSAGPLDQIASAGITTSDSTAVDSGPTGAVPAGELVYGAVITAFTPSSNPSPGSSQGINYTPRVNTGSAFEEDITSSAAGPQDARATFATSQMWYAVVATFHPVPTNAQPPTTPTGLRATNVTATQVSLGWTASTDNVPVAGYTVYRNGTSIGATLGSATSFVDSAVTAGASYSYTVDAVNGADQHSAQSAPVSVTLAGIRFVQGSVNGSLNQPVGAGDLLVGWFAEYNSGLGQLQVSDSVNGAWMKAPGSLTFSGNGQIALFYLQNSHASAAGLSLQVTVPSGASVTMAAADYSGAIGAGAFDQIAMRAGTGPAVDSGPTGSIGGGELVYGALITGAAHSGVGTVTPGSSRGINFTPRETGGNASVFEEDITSPTPGPQDATATLNYSSDWYAVAATFHPAVGTQPPPPPPVAYNQGAAFSTASRVASAQVQLNQPVAAGDLLVGWFAQYNTSGQVQVADSVNGAWTRAGASTTFWGSGDIALYYVQNSKASPGGLTITVSVPASAYLQGAVADYYGVATTGALDNLALGRFGGTYVSVCGYPTFGCPTTSRAAGELTYAALIAGGSPGTVTAGSENGVAYTPRASTPSGSVYEEDVTSSPAGAPSMTATLGASTDWYAVVATFRPASA